MTSLRPFAAGMFAPMRNTDRLVAMKNTLDDLNRQLGTGKRAETLGGLGSGRSTSISVRARLADNAAFRAVSQRGQTRAALMSGSINALSSVGSQARRDAVTELAGGSALPVVAGQSRAMARLEMVISALNSDFDGQYLFSGSTAGTKPVLSATEMLGGVGGAAGLNQLIDERRQADLGSGLGRMNLTQAGATTTLSEEAAGLPFGMKLATVANGMTGASASIGGTPASLDVTFSGLPQAGEALEVMFTLPDGSQERLKMTAYAAGTATGDGAFAIGADAATTAANFGAALGSTLAKFAATKLGAASAVVAAQDFFAGSTTNPPRRIDGPPFGTATGFAAAGSRATTIWYAGDDDLAVDPRETQTAQVERGLNVAMGARANEAPIRDMLAGFAALAAGPVPDTETYRATISRSASLVDAMSGMGGRELVMEIGSAQEMMAQATQRHNQADAVLKTALGEVEDVSIEQLSTEILSLQTRLEASYQVTASISKMSLADYLR